MLPLCDAIHQLHFTTLTGAELENMGVCDRSLFAAFWPHLLGRTYSRPCVRPTSIGGPEARRNASHPSSLAVRPAHPRAVVRAFALTQSAFRTLRRSVRVRCYIL